MTARLDDERDEEAVSRFVEWFALALAEAGFQRMAARVFVGLLVADSGRRTAAELAQSLRVSAAAISGAVRYLTQIGLVIRERAPGSRSDHFRVSDDLWYESLLRRDELIGRFEKGISEGVAALGPGTEAGARLEETRRFFEFVRQQTPELMAKWRAYNAAAKRAEGR